MEGNQFVIFVFTLVVTCLLILDIRSLFKHKASAQSTKNAVIWTLIWISTSMLFSVFIWFENGFERFSQFQSAYWIEQSLSVDNLFVFLMVFGFFGINGPSQHKILLWGILGAMVLRGIFIFAGTWLIKLTYLPPFWIFNQDPHIPRAPGSFHQINVLIAWQVSAISKMTKIHCAIRINPNFSPGTNTKSLLVNIQFCYYICTRNKQTLVSGTL